MKFKQLPIAAATAAIMTLPLSAQGYWWHNGDEEEVEFEEAQLYFELNDTDGDLGIHGKADGDAWKQVKIEGPEGDRERTILNIIARSGVRRQGLTELFFESAEPTFDELDPGVFFNRFPQGLYEWEGRTLDYAEIEGEVYLSHIIPAAPVIASIGGLESDDNPGFEDDEGELEKVCWEGVGQTADGGVIVEWEPVTESHFDKWSVLPQPLLDGEAPKIPLGVGGSVEVLYYEFVAEIDDTEFKSTTVVDPGVTTWTIPADFILLAEPDEETGLREIKVEIIVRVESGEFTDEDGEIVDSRPGNQSAVEDCFEI